jgi:hypothetical protein
MVRPVTARLQTGDSFGLTVPCCVGYGFGSPPNKRTHLAVPVARNVGVVGNLLRDSPHRSRRFLVERLAPSAGRRQRVGTTRSTRWASLLVGTARHLTFTTDYRPWEYTIYNLSVMAAVLSFVPPVRIFLSIL